MIENMLPDRETVGRRRHDRGHDRRTGRRKSSRPAGLVSFCRRGIWSVAVTLLQGVANR
jgi:hypothetical protein